MCMHVHMYVYYVYITSKDTHLFYQLSIFIVYSLLRNMLGAIVFIPLWLSPWWLGPLTAFRWACFLWYLITNRGQITPKDLEMWLAWVICKSRTVVGVPFKILSLFNSSYCVIWTIPSGKNNSEMVLNKIILPPI